MTIQSEHIDTLFARMVPDDEAPDEFDSGSPEWLVASLTEGAIDSGVWSCTVGGWEEPHYAVDEVIFMISGRLRLTDADGTVREVGPGDLFFIPKGWSGRWDVLEDMRKVYVIVT